MAAYLCILAGKRNGTLYVGATTNLVQRVEQHRRSQFPGFTSRYSVSRLVYFEEFGDIREAIQSERTIKKWRRSWKVALMEKNNPDWRDLMSS